MYLSQWYAGAGILAGSSNKLSFTQIVVRATSFDSNAVTGGGFLTADECGISQGGNLFTLSDPIKIQQKSDVKMSASDASGITLTAMGTFLGWYE